MESHRSNLTYLGDTVLRRLLHKGKEPAATFLEMPEGSSASEEVAKELLHQKFDLDDH